MTIDSDSLKNATHLTLDLPKTLRGRVDVLACPACHGSLVQASAALHCAACNLQYPVKNGKIYFVESPINVSKFRDAKGTLRELFGANYKRLVSIFGPGYPRNSRKLLLDSVDPAGKCVVDLGSATERIHPDVVTLDLFDYPEVDIVCDLRFLPFAAGKVDAFITTSVLEHVEDPAVLVGRMFVCTKPGGIGIHSFPFLFPYHEAPGDFVRYTHMGARALFKEWRIRRFVNSAGPVTLLNTTAAELMSTLLSFGNQRLKQQLYIGCSALMSPFKYLDVFFVNREAFYPISAVFSIVVEKSVP